jgi:hypothetical protein
LTVTRPTLGNSQRLRHAGFLGHLRAGSPRAVEHILWQTSRKSGKGLLVLLTLVRWPLPTGTFEHRGRHPISRTALSTSVSRYTRARPASASASTVRSPTAAASVRDSVKRFSASS